LKCAWLFTSALPLGTKEGTRMHLHTHAKEFEPAAVRIIDNKDLVNGLELLIDELMNW